MGKRLCVYVPGLSGRAASWAPLINRLKRDPQLAGCTWLPFEHKCTPLGRRRLIEAARELRAIIDQEWMKAEGFDEIYLIGHSIGGLIVRQTFLLAQGIYSTEPKTTDWPAAVKRIVLMASVNNGLRATASLRSRVGYIASKALFWRDCFLNDVWRGSAFITELRLQWIRHFRVTEKELPPEKWVSVVQVLGTADREVSHEDSIDVVQFEHAGHIWIPGADHDELHRLKSTSNPKGHYQLIRKALLGKFRNEEVKREEKKILVFLMHGIRALSDGWVEELKNVVLAVSQREGIKVQVVTPGRYLCALEFAFGVLHNPLVHWFQTQYGEYAARNPEAEFVFAGHSNGTYLLGRSMQTIPAIRFERIYLAGSVLPCSFDWRSLFERQQTKQVRCDCATQDIPVGVLCGALSKLGRSVGTAGIHGFQQSFEGLHHNKYFAGGHSVALRNRRNLRSIACFLVGAEDTQKPVPLASQLPGWVDPSFKLSAIILLILVPLGIIALFVWLPSYIALEILAGLVVLLWAL